MSEIICERESLPPLQQKHNIRDVAQQENNSTNTSYRSFLFQAYRQDEQGTGKDDHQDIKVAEHIDSGIDVPKETTVRLMTISDMRYFLAMAEALLTSQSAPLVSSTKPKTNRKQVSM